MGEYCGLWLHRLALGSRSLVLPLLCILASMPQIQAAPITLEPNKAQDRMEALWQILILLSPYIIALTAAGRFLWIKCRPSRQLKHPVVTGALAIISAFIWWCVRSVEKIPRSKEVILLGMFLLFWMDFVLDSRRLVRDKTSYLLAIVFGGAVVDLLCTALSFISTMNAATAGGLTAYLQQAINNGPFWLIATTVGVYVLQTYAERGPSNSSVLTAPQGHRERIASQWPLLPYRRDREIRSWRME